jgi:hypothetical protein
LDRLPEAQEQLEKVLALNPGNKNVLEAIAEVQRKKRKK